MKCPHCQEEINYANYAETNTGTVDFGKMAENGRFILKDWQEDTTDREVDFHCPSCGEDITHLVITE